jgi:DNA-binding NarL/FixJ family response regulator
LFGGVNAAIRVLVVDDHDIVRQGIRRVLETVDGMTVVAEAGDGNAAIDAARTHAPDVVVLDVKLPGETGLEVCKRLKQAHPDVRILMLSSYDDTEYVLEAVWAGADGYLLKDSTPSVLRDAIRSISAGETVFSQTTSQRLSAGVREGAVRREKADRLARLTGREREVLLQIVDGRTNKETAAALGISHRTVETHRENILKKLGVRSVAELTRLAIETGLARGGHS